MHRTRWSLVLVLCACSSKDSAPPPPPIEDKPSPIVAPSPRPLSLTLLDAGTGDRTPLRYAISTEAIATQIEMKLTQRRMHDGIWADPNVMPPITIGFATGSRGDGALRVRPLSGAIHGKVSADASSYLAAWRASEGRPFILAFDARGQLGPPVFEDDPTSERSQDPIDDMTQRLMSIVVPVPEEPVGVGASWKVTTSLVQRPVVVRQLATYTLLGRTATAWKIGIDIRRSAEPQKIDDSTDVVALTRVFQGNLEVSPARALPIGALAAESSIHLRITPMAGPVVERVLEDKGAIGLTLLP